MKEIQDYKHQGLTITQISALTGHSRPTIRKYLDQASYHAMAHDNHVLPSYNPIFPFWRNA